MEEEFTPPKVSPYAWVWHSLVGILALAVGVAVAFWVAGRLDLPRPDIGEAIVRAIPVVVTLLSFIALPTVLKNQTSKLALEHDLIQPSRKPESTKWGYAFFQIASWRGTFAALIAAGFLPLFVTLQKLFIAPDLHRDAVVVVVGVLIVVFTIVISLAVTIALNFKTWHGGKSLHGFFLGGLIAVYAGSTFLLTLPASSKPTDPCEGFSVDLSSSGWIYIGEDSDGDHWDYSAFGTFKPAPDYTYHVFVVLPATKGSGRITPLIWYRYPLTEVGPLVSATPPSDRLAVEDGSQLRRWRHDRIYMTRGLNETVSFIAIKDDSIGAIIPSYWNQLTDWMRTHNITETVEGTPSPLSEAPAIDYKWPVEDENFDICDEVVPDQLESSPTIRASPVVKN